MISYEKALEECSEFLHTINDGFADQILNGEITQDRRSDSMADLTIGASYALAMAYGIDKDKTVSDLRIALRFKQKESTH